jgi:hypothetical protein
MKRLLVGLVFIVSTPLFAVDSFCDQAKYISSGEELNQVFENCQKVTASDEVKIKAQAYLVNGLYQEAAWIYEKNGYYDNSRKILNELTRILKTKPVQIKELGEGISKPLLVSFSNGIKGVFKKNGAFANYSSANRELAAYKINKLLALNFIPLTILRTIDIDGVSVTGSLTYFIKYSESASKLGLLDIDRSEKILFFDALIGNPDRHTGNWLVREVTGEIIAIDHNLAFTGRYIKGEVLNDNIYMKLRSLSKRKLKKALKGLLTKSQFSVLLENRDRLLLKYKLSN